MSELIKRAKSQAYLLARLRRQYPDCDEAELRAVVDGLRREYRDATTEPVELPPARTPAEWREPSCDPIWASRAERLAAFVTEPLDTPTLLHCVLNQQLPHRLGWRDHNHIHQVLAACEDAGLLEWTDGAWQRPEPEATEAEIAMSEQKPAPAETPAAPPIGQAPTPEAEAERRAKISTSVKRTLAARKAKPAAPTEPTATPSIEDALTPVVRRLVRAELGRVVAEFLNGGASSQ